MASKKNTNTVEITRPGEGTKTGRVWEIADKLTKKDQPAVRAEVMEQALSEGLNSAMIATQYQRWRQFNGVSTRSPRAPREVEEELRAARGDETKPARKKAAKKATKKAARKRVPKPPKQAAAQ